MVKEEISYNSPCGSYLAIVNDDKREIEIYTVENLVLYRKIDIKTAVLTHIQGNHSAIREAELKVTQVAWEKILEKTKTTKIGILVENYALVVIIDIRDDMTSPIVLQQNQIDGICRFEWIPPVDTQESGAYENSRQIIIFCEHNLQAKVFSLDCTSILFTILKPAKSEIYVRPQHNNSIWCVVAHRLDYASSLLVYIFYNTGSVSVPIHEFKVSHNMISDFEFEWSNSGKWLSILSTSESIFGFNLRIFNSLGMHEVEQDENSDLFSTDRKALINIEWKPEGIEEDLSTSLISIKTTNYVSKWLDVDDEEYLLVGSMVSNTEMELVLISIKTLAVNNKSVIKVNTSQNNYLQILDRGIIKYMRYSNLNNMTFSLVLKNIIVVNNYILFDYGDSLLLSELKFHDNTAIINYDSNMFVRFTLNILSYKCLKNRDIILVVTENDLALLDMRNFKIDSIFSSNSKIKDVALFQDNSIIGILQRDYSKREQDLKNWEFIKTSEITQNPDKTQTKPIKTYENNDDTNKVLNLINDANRNDTIRLRRNRFSLFNANTDEITDTFNLIKRQKKIDKI